MYKFVVYQIFETKLTQVNCGVGPFCLELSKGSCNVSGWRLGIATISEQSCDPKIRAV